MLAALPSHQVSPALPSPIPLSHRTFPSLPAPRLVIFFSSQLLDPMPDSDRVQRGKSIFRRPEFRLSVSSDPFFRFSVFSDIPHSNSKSNLPFPARSLSVSSLSPPPHHPVLPASPSPSISSLPISTLKGSPLFTYKARQPALAAADAHQRLDDLGVIAEDARCGSTLPHPAAPECSMAVLLDATEDLVLAARGGPRHDDLADVPVEVVVVQASASRSTGNWAVSGTPASRGIPIGPLGRSPPVSTPLILSISRGHAISTTSTGKGAKIDQKPSERSVTYGQLSRWNQTPTFWYCVADPTSPPREFAHQPGVFDTPSGPENTRELHWVAKKQPLLPSRK